MSEKFLKFTTTTPSSISVAQRGSPPVIINQNYTFIYNSGEFTNTGSGIITYTGIPKGYMCRMQYQQTSANTAFNPIFYIYLNSSSVNSYRTKVVGTSSQGVADKYYQFNKTGTDTYATAVMLNTNDTITFYVANSVLSNTTSSGFQITVTLVSV